MKFNWFEFAFYFTYTDRWVKDDRKDEKQYFHAIDSKGLAFHYWRGEANGQTSKASRLEESRKSRFEANTK